MQYYIIIIQPIVLIVLLYNLLDYILVLGPPQLIYISMAPPPPAYIEQVACQVCVNRLALLAEPIRPGYLFYCHLCRRFYCSEHRIPHELWNHSTVSVVEDEDEDCPPILAPLHPSGALAHSPNQRHPANHPLVLRLPLGPRCLDVPLLPLACRPGPP
jgi:hypothetical protein